MTLDWKTVPASARRIAPFAGACSLAWIAVLVGSSIAWWEYWTAFGLAVAAGGVVLVASIVHRPDWSAVVPSALLLLIAIALLRNSAGGISSGVGALAILPVFQTAVYSRSRRDLVVVLAGVALFYLVPIWVVGSPAYPDSQYRAVVLALAVNGIIGLTIQGLVARVRNQVRESQARERMLEQVTEVVHRLFDSPQPRLDACEAVMAISSATSAVLYEPVGSSGQLVCTATAGVDAEMERIVVPRRSAAFEAMRTGRPVLITENVEAHIGLIDLWIARSRPSSLLYQPLMRGDTPLGVLVIGWARHVPMRGPGATVVALLAHEVAAVISRADAMDSLHDEALTDALTGLPNRRAWERHLRQLSAAGQEFVIGMLDLDHFKEFNDTRGHAAGDRLLKETAAAWRVQIRAGDVLARIGGEEFGLLLLDCDAETAMEIVDRLRHRVTHNRTCSAGLAVKDLGETPLAALERADAALYQAKTQGRDRSKLAEASTGQMFAR